MRFLMTVNGGGRQPDEQLYAEMGRFVEELTRAGVLARRFWKMVGDGEGDIRQVFGPEG